MKIGILGAGMIGGTVGRLWRKAGHEVMFGTRHPEKIAALAKELGAATGLPDVAARFGEVILFAVPLGAVPDLGRALGKDVVGKVVLDASNAYPQRDGDAAHAAKEFAGGSSAWVASLLPGARVVKAFNAVNYKTLEREAHHSDLGIPVASDDPGALELVEQLVRDAGFRPVIVGPLESGKRFEPGTPVYNTGMSAAALTEALELPR